MKFGAHPVGSCVGAVLVHAVYLETGRIRKGTRLTEVDIDRLRCAGRPQYPDHQSSDHG